MAAWLYTADSAPELPCPQVHDMARLSADRPRRRLQRLVSTDRPIPLATILIVFSSSRLKCRLGELVSIPTCPHLHCASLICGNAGTARPTSSPGRSSPARTQASCTRQRLHRKTVSRPRSRSPPRNTCGPGPTMVRSPPVFAFLFSRGADWIGDVAWGVVLGESHVYDANSTVAAADGQFRKRSEIEA